MTTIISLLYLKPLYVFYWHENHQLCLSQPLQILQTATLTPLGEKACQRSAPCHNFALDMCMCMKATICFTNKQCIIRVIP